MSEQHTWMLAKVRRLSSISTRWSRAGAMSDGSADQNHDHQPVSGVNEPRGGLARSRGS